MIKKIFLHAKSVVMILLISIFLISSVKIYADDESSFTKSKTAVYQFMGNYRYLIIPMIDAAAGATLCGPWCAFAGAATGAVDNALVYFGYTNQHYLTHGFIGLTMGNMIRSDSRALKGTAMVVGFLLPNGILSEHQEIIAPSISAAAGGYASGMSGLIVGGAEGVTDELFINSGFTDKHYMTFGNIGIAISSIFLSPEVADFVGAGLGLIAANWEDEIVNYLKGPVNATNKLYDTFSKFVPREQLNQHLEEHAVALVGAQVVAQFFALKVVTLDQDLTYRFEHLDEVGSTSAGFGKVVVRFAIFFVPYIAERITSGVVSGFYDRQLYCTVEDNIYRELHRGENALRLSRNNSSAVYIDNLKDDVIKSVVTGGSLVADAVSSSINGAYGIGMIIISSPDVVVYSFLYNLASTYCANLLAFQKRLYEEKARVTGSDIQTMIKDNNKNARIIAERGGAEISEDRLRDLRLELRDAEELKNLWQVASNTYQTINRISGNILNFYFVANNIINGKVNFDDREKVLYAGRQTQSFFSWPAVHAESMSDLYQSVDRIVILEGMLRAPASGVDQIQRNHYDGTQLKFNQLEISKGEHGEQPLFKIDDTKLDMGKVYAITGNSGRGKSSLLSKIKGVVENGIAGKGSIYYPKIKGKNSKIVMLSQMDYFPLNSTLQQVLAYPNKIPTDSELNNKQREEMLKLLQEAFANFNSKTSLLDLDNKRDWYTLSGGEKKVVLIISAILQKPDILLLDEVFNGIDPVSIKVIQKMLKKYLPDSLILVVEQDDKAVVNNHDNFYSEDMHLDNETSRFVLQPMSII